LALLLQSKTARAKSLMHQVLHGQTLDNSTESHQNNLILDLSI